MAKAKRMNAPKMPNKGTAPMGMTHRQMPVRSVGKIGNSMAGTCATCDAQDAAGMAPDEMARATSKGLGD